MPQTQTQRTPPPNPSVPGTAQWIYDEIMRKIEPDLVTDRLMYLQEIYKNETEEEGKRRMAHYQKAFEIFGMVAAKLEKNVYEYMRTVRQGMHAKAAQKESREHAQDIENIESAFDDE